MLIDITYLLIFSSIIVVLFKFYISKNYPVEEQKFLFIFCFISFALRGALVLLTLIFPQYLVPSDAIGYETDGLALANALKEGHWLSGLPFVNASYYYYNAFVYILFGFHPVILRILNCAFGVMTGILLYDTGKAIKSVRFAKIASLLFMFWPSLIFYSTLNLKDTLILFFIVLTIKYFVGMLKRLDLRNAISVLLFIIVLFSLRFYVGMIVMSIFIILIIYLAKVSLPKKIIFFVMIIIGWGIVTNILGYGFMGSKLFAFFNFDFINNHKQQLQEKYSSSQSNIFLDLRIYTIWDALKFLPVGFTYFMFAPFPWQAKGILQIAAMPENIVWYLLFIFFTIPGCKFFLRKENLKIGLIMLAYCSIITLMYSLTLDNIGIAYRMKLQILPFWFLILGAGMDERLNKFKNFFCKKNIKLI